jgi:hypothetical protein
MSSLNVAIAHVLADDAAILAFDQSIIVGSAGAGFGLFDEEFVEKVGDDGVDKLAPIVGVEPLEEEGEAGDGFSKSGEEEVFTDGLNTDDNFPLSNGINEVDVIDAFCLIEIPLVDGINTDMAGLPVGLRATADTDGDMDGFGAGECLGMTFIFFGLPQIVNMRRGDVLKTTESFIAIDSELSLKKPSRGRPGKTLMSVVGFDQEKFVGQGVGARKPVTVWGRANFEMPLDPPEMDQTCDLRTRDSGHPLEITTNQATVFFQKRSVTKPLECFCDPGIFVVSRETFEGESRG